MPEETETTNKVLETKIDALSKLTDERFSSMKETLLRIEQASFVTVIEYNKKHDEVMGKISILETAKAKAEGSVTTLKILWGVGVVVLGIFEFILTKYF